MFPRFRRVRAGRRALIRRTVIDNWIIEQDQIYLPFLPGKWKESSAGTSENRIQHHIVKGLGGLRLEDLTLAPLHQFLEQKATAGFSFSICGSSPMELTSMFELAVSERAI